MRNGKVWSYEDRLQQDIHRLVIALKVQVFDACGRAAYSGIVPEDIEAAEGRRSGIDLGFELILVGNVAMDVLDRVGSKLRLKGRAFFILHIAGDHFRAFGHEGFDPAEANAAGRAGDHRNFSRQIGHGLGSPSFWVVGRGRPDVSQARDQSASAGESLWWR